MEFKEGDEVIRVDGDWGDMVMGDIATVVNVYDHGRCVDLNRFGVGHQASNLRLFDETACTTQAVIELDDIFPSVAEQRKATPVFSGCINYFPDALQAVAQCSKVGNDQHNPGEPLHWAREKSGDELDALTRHLIDAGTIDTDGIRHSTKVAWRALANLQKEIENARTED